MKISLRKKGIEYLIDSRIELINALFSATKRIKDDNYTWIADYNTPYINEIVKLVDIENNPELLSFIKKGIGKYQDVIYLAYTMDQYYNIDESMFNDDLKQVFKTIDLLKFNDLIKELVKKISFNKFFKSKYLDYQQMIEECTSYSNDISVKEIENFFNKEKRSYQVVFSPLIIGGFGIQIHDNLLCVKGIRYHRSGHYNESTSGLSNIYHEFSHPFVNPLIDEYYGLFKNPKKILKESVSNGLPTYYNESKTVLYEYIVKSVSYYLTSKHKDAKIEIEYDEKNGFPRIKEILELITNNIDSYILFESMLVHVIIPYLNNI